jgi:hypothetical protein
MTSTNLFTRGKHPREDSPSCNISINLTVTILEEQHMRRKCCFEREHSGETFLGSRASVFATRQQTSAENQPYYLTSSHLR